MSKTLRALSAFIFLVGCLATLLALLAVWTTLMVLAAHTSIVLGWGLLGVSLLVFVWWRGPFEALWHAWHRVWEYADATLDARLSRFPGGHW